MGKTKLHEILAVDGGLKKTAALTIEEGVNTFKKRSDHFSGHVRSYTPKNEEDSSAIEQGVTERTEITTTVIDKLKYVFGHVSSHIDAMAAKDTTNQDARADIVIGDVAIASGVASVTLLSLETEIQNYRTLIAAVPTLPPGTEWVPAHDIGENVFKMVHPEKKTRTRRVLQNHVKYDATPEHPAQVDTYSEDIPIGVYTTKRISGAITPAHKSVLLARVDELHRAVKQARQRANSTLVTKKDIGKSIVDFLLNN